MVPGRWLEPRTLQPNPIIFSTRRTHLLWAKSLALNFNDTSGECTGHAKEPIQITEFWWRFNSHSLPTDDPENQYSNSQLYKTIALGFGCQFHWLIPWHKDLVKHPAIVCNSIKIWPSLASVANNGFWSLSSDLSLSFCIFCCYFRYSATLYSLWIMPLYCNHIS